MISFHALSERPLRASLDELVHQQAQVGQDEATHEEREELCRVTDAELQADMRLRRVLEARIFDLASDLICEERTNLVSGLFSEEINACGSCLVLVKLCWGCVIARELGHEGWTTARFGGSGADPTHKGSKLCCGHVGWVCVLRRQRMC